MLSGVPLSFSPTNVTTPFEGTSRPVPSQGKILSQDLKRGSEQYLIANALLEPIICP